MSKTADGNSGRDKGDALVTEQAVFCRHHHDYGVISGSAKLTKKFSLVEEITP